jgi:hypothetical protein
MATMFSVRPARSSTKGLPGINGVAVAVAALLLSSLLSSASAAGNPAKLSQIFMPGMLEAKVASFEEVAGKASKVLRGSDKSTERRIYKIERCEVEAAFGQGTLRSLHMRLGDRCTFELAAFFATARGLPTVSKVTFGDVERALRVGSMVGICLFPCGKAYHPAVFEHIEGSKEDNFVDAVLEVGLVDDVAMRAASEWTKLAQKDRGNASLKGARFNCDGRHDEAGRKLFDKVRITAIRIGYNFTEPWQCD